MYSGTHSSAGSPSVFSNTNPNKDQLDNTRQNAALSGATRAFRSTLTPDLRPLPASTNASTNTYSGQNGALAAATKVGGRVSKSPGTQERTPIVAATSSANTATSSSLNTESALSHTPTKTGSLQKQSTPSYIAATLAASRASPLPPTSQPIVTKARSRTPLEQNDESSIAATSELIEKFGGGRQAVSGRSGEQVGPQSPVIRPSQPILSPVPVRPVKPLPEPTKAMRAPPPKPPSATQASDQGRRTGSDGNGKAAPIPASTARPKSLPATKKVPSTTPEKLTAKTRPEPPPPRRTTAAPLTQSPDSSPSQSAYASAEDELPSTKARSSRSSTQRLSQTRPSLQQPQQPQAISVHNSSKMKRPPPILPARRSSSASRPVSTIPQSLKPQLTADSLANAMVASSLASSRAPSPSKDRFPGGGAPALPPRADSGPYQYPNPHKTYSFSLLVPSPTTQRTPSPLKSMRQTLRRGDSSDTDFSGVVSGNERSKPKDHWLVKRNNTGDSTASGSGSAAAFTKGWRGTKIDKELYGGGRHGLLRRKHPHKHAEGDRQRWRESITEKERKRYEGVWAANKGLVKMTPPDEVHALVVRDVWSRSGLGARVLEQIWDLVQGGEKGVAEDTRRSLRRHEFVVGLWLVDQSLKGRRLPVEVGDSVWSSARGLTSGLMGR